ncbi:MAG: MliC family protein [Alphaproteobacteria bacterium]
MRSNMIAAAAAILALVLLAFGFNQLTSTSDKDSEPGTAFTCDDGTRFHAVFSQDPGLVTLRFGEERTPRILALPQARSGSGTRYRDDDNEFREHQGEATLELADGTELTGCKAED